MNPEALKKAALAATPGPWSATHWNCHAATTVMRSGDVAVIAETTGFGRDATECAVDAAFIAAANPAAVLALIASHDQLVADLAEARAEADQYRKDAERYRYLRDWSGSGECLRLMHGDIDFDADNYIDAALAAAGTA